MADRAGWPIAIVAIHWATALLALATACYGIYLLSPPEWSQAYIDRYFAGIHLHKIGGLAVLGLALCWLALRAAIPRPPLAARGGARRFVLGVHGALLGLMVLLPASGYLMDTLAGNGIALFGGFEIPSFLRRNDPASVMLSYFHKWAGFALLGLAALHAAGGLRHLFRPAKGDTARSMLLHGLRRK